MQEKTNMGLTLQRRGPLRRALPRKEGTRPSQAMDLRDLPKPENDFIYRSPLWTREEGGPLLG